jgi:hypothetical protein
MSKLKSRTWRDLSRTEQRARVLWPDLAEPEHVKEMEEIARLNGKRAPQGLNLIPHVPWNAQPKQTRGD